MSELVECCITNLTGQAGACLVKVDDVRTSLCLDRCERCHDGPFLVIGGEPVSGESYRTILSARAELE